MFRRELWQKADECARAVGATSDPTARQILTILFKLWANLANESSRIGDDKLAEQIALISQIHADATRTTLQ